MIPSLTYYTDEVIQTLSLQCKDREIFLKSGENVSHRPLQVNSAEELKWLIQTFNKNSILGIHVTIEKFSDPLLLAEQSPDKLRVGWDLLIDLDTDNIQDAKRTALAVIALLNHFCINSVKVKFSGRRGFHIIIPGLAFHNFKTDREFITAYPNVPKAACRFIEACLKPEQKKGVTFDYEVYRPRHLMRLAYSLHEETGLVSMPVDVSKINGFDVNDAKQNNVDIDYGWINLKARIGEASKLMDAVSEWIKINRKNVQGIKIVRPQTTSRNQIKWIEKLLETPVSDGRHRITWLILAPYLVTVKGLDLEDAYDVIMAWLDRCNKLRPVASNTKYFVRYQCKNALRNRLRPLSLNKLKRDYPDLYIIISNEMG